MNLESDKRPNIQLRLDFSSTPTKQHWPAIREQLLNGTYQPKPVRRVEIPKPDGGGVRKLGIPTVLDRFIQQAVMQVLRRRWNPTFSQYSYGFRPRRSAHQAVAQAQQYIAQGCGWVIDLDLEKFFDRVNHDGAMGGAAQLRAECLPCTQRPRKWPSGHFFGALPSSTTRGRELVMVNRWSVHHRLRVMTLKD